MIGVAIISITLVPALIPSFIKGRLRSEEESWLVRNMIAIYSPGLPGSCHAGTWQCGRFRRC